MKLMDKLGINVNEFVGGLIGAAGLHFLGYANSWYHSWGQWVEEQEGKAIAFAVVGGIIGMVLGNLYGKFNYKFKKEEEKEEKERDQEENNK